MPKIFSVKRLGAQTSSPITRVPRLMSNSDHHNFPGEPANYDVVGETTEHQSLGAPGACGARHRHKRDDCILKQVKG